MNKKFLWGVLPLLLLTCFGRASSMSRRSRLRRALIRWDNATVISLLERNQHLTIDWQLLDLVAQHNRENAREKIVLIGPVCAWCNYNVFREFNDRAADLIIEHLAQEVKTDPWLLHAAICSGRDSVVRKALAVFQEAGGDINLVQEYCVEQGLISQYQFTDFIIKADCCVAIQNNFAIRTLNLFFEHGLRVKTRIIRRTASSIYERNAFEFYFSDDEYRQQLIDQLWREFPQEGCIAQLLASIREENVQAVRLYSAQVPRDVLLQETSPDGLCSPVDLAMRTKNDEITSLLLDRVIPFLPSSDDGAELLTRVVVRDFPLSAHRLLASAEVPVYQQTIYALFHRSPVFDVPFALKLLDRYQQSGGTPCLDLIAHLFKFSLGRVGSEELIERLKRDAGAEGLFDDALVHLIENKMREGELKSCPFQRSLCRKAISYLDDPNRPGQDNLPLATCALQSLNVFLFRLMKERGADIPLTVAMLRHATQPDEDSEFMVSNDQDLLTEDELLDFAHKRQSLHFVLTKKRRGTRLQSLVKEVNDELIRRKPL
ncbi:hypothetical protein ACFLX2_00930 [Candidatus Dependentiae bacterium]